MWSELIAWPRPSQPAKCKCRKKNVSITFFRYVEIEAFPLAVFNCGILVVILRSKWQILAWKLQYCHHCLFLLQKKSLLWLLTLFTYCTRASLANTQLIKNVQLCPPPSALELHVFIDSTYKHQSRSCYQLYMHIHYMCVFVCVFV